MEYLTVLSTGLVALLVGGEIRGGEFLGGEVLRVEDLKGGDPDCDRDGRRLTGVTAPVGGAGGGVNGGSGRVSTD